MIKGEVNATAAQPTFGSERALTFFAGLAGSHPVRAQIISKLQQQVDTTGWPRLKRPQAPLPLKAYIRAICIFSGSLCLVWKKECSQKKKRRRLYYTPRQNGNPA